MTPRHLDDLFSAAYENDLSPSDEARFEAHIHSCQPCSAAFAEFKAGVEALRELPKARMPLAVHLPSTLPVAERSPRPTIGLSWFNLGLVRRFPATAVAGAIAIVLVILAVTHAGGPGASNSTASLAPNAPSAEHGESAADAACASRIIGITGTALPPNFIQENLTTDPAEPAVHLVLAAPTMTVTAGKAAVVYAQLSVPSTSISNLSAATAPPAKAVLPCVSVVVGSTNKQLAAVPAAGTALTIPPATPETPGTAAGGPAYETEGAAGPLLTFQVPAGLAAGTEIHVSATIPAGYTGLGSPQLTAQLTLTVG